MSGEKPTECLPISSKAYLKVTRTVYSILRHIAGVAIGLPVWEDAFCINQGDTRENSVQVSMMGDIYAAALTQAGDPALWSYLKSPYNHNNTAPDSMGGFGRVGNTLLGSILQSSLFERAWFVQEVCLARKVLFLYGGVQRTNNFPRFSTWNRWGLRSCTVYDIQVSIVSHVIQSLVSLCRKIRCFIKLDAKLRHRNQVM